MTQSDVKLKPSIQLTAWLDVLNAAIPLSGILGVGAGVGLSSWVKWLEQQPNITALLIEGDDEQYKQLRKKIASLPSFQARKDVIVGKTAVSNFYQTNNAAESGILPIEALQKLWPNLCLKQKITIDMPLTLDDLALDIEADVNWLVVDCLPAADLLSGAKKLLETVDVVLARVVSGQTLELIEPANFARVEQLLVDTGFRFLSLFPERHPSIGLAIFIRDIEQIKKVKAAALDVLQNELKALHDEHSQLVTTGMAEKKAKEKALAQRDQLQKEKTAAEQALKELVAGQALELQRLKEELQKAASLKSSEKEMKEYAVDQSLLFIEKQIKESEVRVRKLINKGLMNAVKQLEAFWGIYNWFQSGNSFLSFHGWPISPDMGLFILEKMQEKHYDLIVEFGSGTSTVLLAKSVESFLHQIGDLDQTKKGPPLPEIFSFEHDAVYFTKTKKALQSAGLDRFVRLMHSPLVDWESDGATYKFYDCQTELINLANKHKGANLRILVLIDGPPSSTCSNARYPAVPYVFSILQGNNIDIMLDDAARPEEKKVIDLWRSYWQRQSINVIEGFVSSEKGIYYAESK